MLIQKVDSCVMYKLIGVWLTHEWQLVFANVLHFLHA